MKLEEIFKNNPQLLENDEVKKLIKYCEETFNRQTGILVKYKDFHDNVLEIVMNSKIVLVNGTNEKASLVKILDLLETN